MSRVVGHGANAVEIEGLSVEDIVGEALVQELDEILGRSTAHKACFHAVFFHHRLEILNKRQGDTTSTGLKRESILHYAGLPQETRNEFGNTQAIWRTRDLSSARDNFRRVANRLNFDDIVHVVSLNVPGNARERNQIVSDDDDVIGVDGIG